MLIFASFQRFLIAILLLVSLTSRASAADQAQPEFRQSSSVALGVGITEMTYSEDNDSDTHARYASLKAPNENLEAHLVLSEKWRLIAGVKTSPGDADSSDQLKVVNTAYSWTIYSGEALYIPESFQFSLFGFNPKAGIRFGVQYHEMPYLSRVGLNTVTILNEPVAMATVGPQADVLIDPATNFEIFLRYQYPMSGSAAFKVNPSLLTFDGSVGVSRMIHSNWAAGIYWYGQLQDYSFDYNANGFSGSGHQQIFYSSLEARLSYLL